MALGTGHWTHAGLHCARSMSHDNARTIIRTLTLGDVLVLGTRREVHTTHRAGVINLRECLGLEVRVGEGGYDVGGLGSLGRLLAGLGCIQVLGRGKTLSDGLREPHLHGGVGLGLSVRGGYRGRVLGSLAPLTVALDAQAALVVGVGRRAADNLREPAVLTPPGAPAAKRGSSCEGGGSGVEARVRGWGGGWADKSARAVLTVHSSVDRKAARAVEWHG